MGTLPLIYSSKGHKLMQYADRKRNSKWVTLNEQQYLNKILVIINVGIQNNTLSLIANNW